MSNDIKEYVQKCPECQLQNQIHKESSTLHPIPEKSKVFSMVGLDLVGPLKTTTNGNRFVAVLIDYFSKRPGLGATNDVKSQLKTHPLILHFQLW